LNKPSTLIFLTITLSGMLLWPWVSAQNGLPIYIHEFHVSTPNSAPLAITVDGNGDVWFAEWGADNIGVVRSNSNVPLSVLTPVNSLIVDNGQQVTIPLQIKIQQNLPGNGTLRYAWGSYNPKDVSGIFSSQ
jgi:hypothetical protein